MNITLRKALVRIVSLLPASLLASCVIYTDHAFTGKRRIEQKDHWIELKPGDLARTAEDKWYIYGGPGQYQGATGVSCFEFTVGLPSYKQPPPFEIIRVDVVCDKRWAVKLYRLPMDQEEKHDWDKSTHEIWVESQPSPRNLPSTIAQGTYQIKIHYRLGGQEFDAEWQGVYKARTRIEPWRMPRCQTMPGGHLNA